MHDMNFIEMSWLMLGVYTAIQLFIILACDMTHAVPKWSLRLFMLAAGLHFAGVFVSMSEFLVMALLVSVSGLFWVIFGMIQDMKQYFRNHQHRRIS